MFIIFSSYYFEFISVCCDLNIQFVRLRVRRPYDTSITSRCHHLPIITVGSLHCHFRQFLSPRVSPTRHSNVYLQSFAEICIPVSDIVAYKGCS